MKIFIIALFVALVVAEPPPSNSYLPPPPGGNGYSQIQTFEAPEIVAARSLEASHGQARGTSGSLGQDYHDVHGNGFGRNALRGYESPQARFNGKQSYDNAASFGRNAFDGANTEPAKYNFGYMVKDQEGTEFGHHEERQEQRAQGEYHVVLPDGKKQTVNYEADEQGFKPQISYQDTDVSRSGYDNNAQLFRTNGRGNYGNARSSGY
ncbi:hypothetical protein O3G_MSEX014130 [Manduca sexta]|uniref:Cuticle protein n=1 Tax=Manduca sexta TaxID=7130 RepID=A0A921ZUI8_MANSE|nr:hypothetical protein O3G_MSEX014130 [Manduca sexta]KAG6463885.1 hypothetical protein O3G_MSEX014130 [Manduca sexta]